MRTEHDYIVLDNGRRIYVSAGVIGIDERGEAFNGYDGDFGEYEPDLTPEERREVAEAMVERWRKWGGL